MNYGELKTHFKDVLNRSDITDAQAVRFISDGIGRIERQLRTAMNEKVKNYTITAQTSSITLPADFIETVSLYHSDREIRRVPMSQFRKLVNNTYAGKPDVYTRLQQDLLLHPQPSDGTLTLYYYGQFDPMSQDTDENILAAAAPDLIIYSALTYASDFYLDERTEQFETKYQRFLLEVQEQANDQEMSGGTQVINPAYSYGDY